MVATAVELAVHRANTFRYINLNPYEIILTPVQETFVAGTKTRTPQVDRDSQIFHVVWGFGTSGHQGTRGISESAGLTNRKFDFIIIGNYDAELEIGDFWKIGEQMNQVEFLFPYNGYEVKGGGTSYGGSPPNV